MKKVLTVVEREELESAGLNAQRRYRLSPGGIEADVEWFRFCLRSAMSLPHREIQGQGKAQENCNALMASPQQLNFREMRAR